MKYKEYQGLYRLEEPVTVELIHTYPTHVSEYVNLSGSTITLEEDFVWNGSDVINDSKQGAKASAVHDALCRLYNSGVLSNRYNIDSEYNSIAKDEGMGIIKRSVIRTSLWFYRLIN